MINVISLNNKFVLSFLTILFQWCDSSQSRPPNNRYQVISLKKNKDILTI